MLLHVRLDTCYARGSCVLVANDIDKLVNVSAKAQNSQVADSIEEVIIERSPLVGFNFAALSDHRSGFSTLTGHSSRATVTTSTLGVATLASISGTNARGSTLSFVH